MKIFDSIRVKRPRLNKFDLTHERKMSLNMGDLVPILVQDVVPGDKFRVNTEAMLRLAPMLAPVMHRVDVFTHYFFVPNRLVWNEWEDFITGGREGTTSPTAPFIAPGLSGVAALFDIGSLADFMGLPVEAGGYSSVTDAQSISALPFRAYQRIYDDYYRDQNLEAPIGFSISGGQQNLSNSQAIMALRKRAWEKDYFTSALPWSQRGAESELPVENTITYREPADVKYLDDTNPVADTPFLAEGSGLMKAAGVDVKIENIDEIAGSVTINDLRRSIRLQEWLEKNARGGARYIEQILSHFGVKSSDARLQRAEYLGGGKAPVTISEVLSTTNFDDGAEGIPQGNMAGHGVSVGRSNGFKRTFEEHGYIIGIMSVLPRTAYQQGIPRHFSRFDKFDYYWPEFANIGEQEILLKELYYDPTAVAGQGTETFGYQSRYAEYKYAPSTVHGEFRDSLTYWHMGRIFSAKPVLNAAFVKSDPTDRIFSVEDPTSEKLYAHLLNRVSALRPMPYFGTPTI